MKNYLYPKNLKSRTKILKWQARDFIVIVFFSIICVTILANTLRAEQFVFLFVYAILTIVTEEDRTLCSYVTIAAKHFLLEQQKYLWK